MTPDQWKEMLWPRAEDDPAFRREIDRLSVVGLRAVGAIAIAANLLGYFLLLLWLPSIPARMAWSDFLATVLIVFGVALTFSSKAAPYARAIALAILFVASAEQTVSLLDLEELPLEPGGMMPVSLAVILLLTISVLPVKPIHAFSLGAWMIGIFFWNSFGRTRFIELSFEDAFPVSVMLIMLFMATVLTAVIYRQRLEAFLARAEAEASFRELQQAQSRLLVSKNAASQSRLAAALAHELNTPLGALTSALDTLASAYAKRASDDDRLREVVASAGEVARRSLKRLDETVERMKRFTNLDRAELQEIDLNQLLRDTVNLIDDELAPRVRFEMDLAPVPKVRARPQQLAAVFSNLVRNAAAAIHVTGDDGTIRVSAASRDHEILIEVTDDGEGIDDEALPHLFEPTFRAERGRVGTTNWGLFTSRGIVTAHGGHIEIESELGKGTTARVRLPVVDSSA